MAEFNYEAIDGAGKRSQGTLTANTEREAMSQLDGRGLFPIWIKPKQVAARKLFGFGGKVGGRHMATF
jgi:type II secretory pathway component PulF